MNTLNFRDYTDTPDHDDACMVCDKIDCICPPEEDLPVPVLAESREGALPSAPIETQRQARESTTSGSGCAIEGSDSRGGENSFDLDAEIDRQRALGYETFDDYINRTGFPRDEA